MAVVWITWRNKVWRPEKTWWHSHGGIKSLTPFKDLVCVLRISPLLELFLSMSTIAHRCLHKLEELNCSDWLLCVYVPGWPPTVTFKQSGGPDDTHIMNPSASFIHPTHSAFTALHPCLCTRTLLQSLMIIRWKILDEGVCICTYRPTQQMECEWQTWIN